MMTLRLDGTGLHKCDTFNPDFKVIQCAEEAKQFVENYKLSATMKGVRYFNIYDASWEILKYSFAIQDDKIPPASLREWFEQNFNDDVLGYAENISCQGCICGFMGVTTYTETGELYTAHKAEIWEMLAADAPDCGYTSVLGFIASFSQANTVEDDVTFENLLVWWAVERIAGDIVAEFDAKTLDAVRREA